MSTKQLAFRIPNDLRNEILADCEQEKTTISEWIKTACAMRLHPEAFRDEFVAPEEPAESPEEVVAQMDRERRERMQRAVVQSPETPEQERTPLVVRAPDPWPVEARPLDVGETERRLLDDRASSVPCAHAHVTTIRGAANCADCGEAVE